MSLDELKERINHIRTIAYENDDESAYNAEIQLRHDVLKAIAEGSANAEEIAKLVLTTSDIEFGRW